MPTPLLSCQAVGKHYSVGGQTQVVLQGVDLHIVQGEFVALTGPSGSGKSTLMYLLGALDRATTGEIHFMDQAYAAMDDADLARLRNRHIGFVFQAFHLLGRYDLVRNVALPMVYSGWSERERRERARHLLARVGLGEHMEKTPAQLSGGQQQRVAVARALANGPQLLLADEPTGALDSKSGEQVLDLISTLQQEDGLTVVMVTHDPVLAGRATRQIRFQDGRVYA